ncbi:MAG: hypothetical protein K8H86_05365, partial [Ignavibacteriaceae bacterium]|nr:hypothetical protein [Ignavibacteriaceae bacterium]
MRFFFFFFFISLCSSAILGQYNVDDKELVRTTFKREFNKSVINEYLNSGVDEKINAALLSLSHSSDTTFIPKIITIDDKYLRLISFALGQLGPNKLSEQYLLSKLNSDYSPQKHFLANELGKVISKDVFNQLIENCTGNKINGISLLIANYHLRGENYDKVKTSGILAEELKGNDKQKFEALYSAYRTGLCSLLKDEIINLLKDELRYPNIQTGDAAKDDLLVYTLACLRKLKFFPDNKNLFEAVLSSKSFPVLIEGVKSVVYKKNFSPDDFLNFSILLKHKNINIAVQTAASLKDVVLSKDVFDLLFDKVIDQNLDVRIRGELAASSYKLYPTHFLNKWEIIKPLLSDEYLFTVYNMLPTEYYSLDSLFQSYPHSSASVKIKILDLTLNDKNNLSNSSTTKFIFDVLKSSFAAGISIAADGLDSTFCRQNKDRLKKIILQQTNNCLHNTGFIESLISLSNLAYKISNDFGKEISILLSDSDLYSVKKFAAAKLNLDINLF